MANIKSSKKSILNSLINRKNNMKYRSMIRTFYRKITKSISSKEEEVANNFFRIFQSLIDRQANKGLIHKNKASRYKSRLIRKIKNIKNTLH